jgi:very-short-patch-repair endonuclease
MDELSAVQTETTAQSVFDSNLTVEAKIERARTELLDLGARNRLLNVPRFSKSAKTIDVVEEKSSEVFRILVTEGKAMTFLAGAKGREPKEGEQEEEALVELALPDDDERDDAGRLLRHGDTKLQTKMTPNALQKRLLDLYFDARTLEEEQGVNILYLGLGTLKWIDPNNSENIRYAPLILVPVKLDRGSAAERFKLRARPEDFASNLSLEAFLDRIHKIRMPEFEASEDFSLEEYAAKVAEAISIKPGWSVQPDDIVLGFFSFAKFLMYRDLDPSLWPADRKFTERQLVRSLVSEGFERSEELMAEDANIDRHISPAEMTHIVDADSSQTVAIHEARKGRDLVIQGPPGTGKSQTIANIIAAAVADGKTVLFVAEKMAALEVVKRRLDQAGVGDACLELHSNKANKRAVLAELQHVWDLGAPKGEAGDALNRRLTEARDALNAHPLRMHRVYQPYELSPFQVIGHLSRLRRQGMPPSIIELPQATSWTPESRERIVSLLSELAERIQDIGLPVDHPWYGVGLTGITPLDLERLTGRLRQAAEDLAHLVGDMNAVAARLERDPPLTITAFKDYVKLADRIASCPEGVEADALANPVWESEPAAISKLATDGSQFARLREEVDASFKPEAWTVDPSPVAEQYRRLPKDFQHTAFATVAKLDAVLPRFLSAASALRVMLGVNASPTLTSIDRLLVIGQRVAEAPDASPDAFVAAIWERGLDQAGDLAEAVSTLRQVQSELAGKVLDQAWDVDLTSARTAVAMHGEKLFKFLSGDWRRAKALLKTVMPETTPAETIRILDLLQKGKQARAVIKDGDSLGRSAFGADWRGERSDPKPLENLVLWMRSLRGVGAEARLIASRLSDKAAVAARCEQVGGLLHEVRSLLTPLWFDLGEETAKLFSDAPGAEGVPLTDAVKFVREVSEADSDFSKLTRDPATDAGSRVRGLEILRDAQKLKAQILSAENLGAASFGSRWRGENSDWTSLGATIDWVASNGDIRLLTSRVSERQELAEAAHAASEAGDTAAIQLGDILDYLKANREVVLGAESVNDAAMELVRSKIDRWIANDEQLSKWTAYKGRSLEASEAGVAPVVERLDDGRVAPAEVISFFEMAFYEAILRHQHQQDTELARFDGEVHGRLVSEFANLDKSRMALSRLEVVRAHHKKIPAVMGIGPVGVLRGEMAKKSRHMPIRQLMQRAAPAIQALKPVFMMSPLSIAQFLPPGLFDFDLLVMDEASQIQPVDALGAVARAKQVVVVGDERQLPPTRFFAKMTSGGSEEDNDQDGAQVSDIESILGLFSARGLPQRMLRWHYRSRHQSLIAVSNSQFYDSKLFIVPSPYTKEAGMGLRFHYVPNGVFEDGMNKTEAKVVAEAIIRHAMDSPKLSLGVAAFSIKQRREIQDQLELLRRLNPQAEEFFHAHPHEPFFVKNLENVQGDERDVILISVAYAKNAQGYMGMRFGPLGAEGGERRLNVIISRAKRRCEVYASITDEDIDLERGKGKGVFAFKLFLHYARTGRLSMNERTDRQIDSVFEEQVMAALQEKGYQVHPQVGIAGFFVDLAVADVEVPGRYLLGIECDGAEYHSSRSARDRDRLRQAVLEDHGWAVHRIWSTDWFQRPKAELERVVGAIERAKAEAVANPLGAMSSTRAVPVEVVTIERADVTEIGLEEVSKTGTAATAYKEVQLHANVTGELHEAPIGVVVSLVKQTVQAEGPIHRDEVVTRIRTAWGLQRAGNRIDSHIGSAIDIARRSGEVVANGDFLFRADAPVSLRDRSAVVSPSLRRIELIPPQEIDQGLKEIIEASLGATAEQAVNAISRGLGFKSTSAQLRSLVMTRIDALKREDVLVEADGMLTIVRQPEPV